MKIRKVWRKFKESKLSYLLSNNVQRFVLVKRELDKMVTSSIRMMKASRTQSYALLTFNYLDFLIKQKRKKKKKRTIHSRISRLTMSSYYRKNNKQEIKKKNGYSFYLTLGYISFVKIRIFHIEKWNIWAVGQVHYSLD